MKFSKISFLFDEDVLYYIERNRKKKRKAVIGVEISEKQAARSDNNAAGLYDLCRRRLAGEKGFYKDVFYGDTVYVS